jgi:hypothetical protein
LSFDIGNSKKKEICLNSRELKKVRQLPFCFSIGFFLSNALQWNTPKEIKGGGEGS